MTEDALFEEPPRAKPPRAKIEHPVDRRPTWTMYKVQWRTACDECLMVLHQGLTSALPMSATQKRAVLGHPELTMLLCQPHAVEQRLEDNERWPPRRKGKK